MARRRNFIRKRNLDKLKISRSKYQPHQGLREQARRLVRMSPGLVLAHTDEMRKYSAGVKSFLDQYGSVGYHELESWLNRRNRHAQKDTV